MKRTSFMASIAAAVGAFSCLKPWKAQAHVCSPEDCGMRPSYDFSNAKRRLTPEESNEACLMACNAYLAMLRPDLMDGARVEIKTGYNWHSVCSSLKNGFEAKFWAQSGIDRMEVGNRILLSAELHKDGKTYPVALNCDWLRNENITSKDMFYLLCKINAEALAQNQMLSMALIP